MRVFLCLIISLIFFACSFGEGSSSSNLNVDIVRVANEQAISGKNYLLSNGAQWYTPDSFIIQLGTLAINDEEGNFLTLFDAADDGNCISIDLGKGEKLSDKVDLSVAYESDKIAWMAIAILPQIQYNYTDSSGASHSGQLDLEIVSGGSGYYYDIGEARNRKAYGVDLYEPDLGWEDTRLYLSDDIAPELIIYFDLENIIYDSDEDGTPEIIYYDKLFYPVTDKCNVEYYYLKNANGADDIYPYRITMLKNDSGLPIYGQVFARDFKTDMTSEYELAVLNNMYFNSHSNRDDVIIINNDNSFDLILQNGTTISGIVPEENQTLSIDGKDIRIKYEKKY